VALEGRTRIEKERIEQIAKIEANRKEALSRLNLQYAIADKVKTSFGIIGTLFILITWCCIILNDMVKLFSFLFEETKIYLVERRKLDEKQKREVLANQQVEIQLDERYNQKLEEKLEQIHLQLVKACAAARQAK